MLHFDTPRFSLMPTLMPLSADATPLTPDMAMPFTLLFCRQRYYTPFDDASPSSCHASRRFLRRYLNRCVT